MERRGPAVHDFFANMGGRGEMIKTPIDLQDLRRRIYAKAKAELPRRGQRRGFGWKRWSTCWRDCRRRKRLRYDGPHNPWHEVDRKA